MTGRGKGGKGLGLGSVQQQRKKRKTSVFPKSSFSNVTARFENFAIVPEEIICKILSYLALNDALTCQLACKQFYQVSQSLFLIASLQKYKKFISETLPTVESQELPEVDVIDSADEGIYRRQVRKLYFLDLQTQLLNGIMYNCATLPGLESLEDVEVLFSKEQRKHIQERVIQAPLLKNKNRIQVLTFDKVKPRTELETSFDHTNQCLIVDLPETDFSKEKKDDEEEEEEAEVNGSQKQDDRQIVLLQRFYSGDNTRNSDTIDTFYYLYYYTHSPVIAAKLGIPVGETQLLLSYTDYREDTMIEHNKKNIDTIAQWLFCSEKWKEEDFVRLLLILTQQEHLEENIIEELPNAQDAGKQTLLTAPLPPLLVRLSTEFLQQVIARPKKEQMAVVRNLKKYNQYYMSNEIIRPSIEYLDTAFFVPRYLSKAELQKMLNTSGNYLRVVKGQVNTIVAGEYASISRLKNRFTMASADGSFVISFNVDGLYMPRYSDDDVIDYTIHYKIRKQTSEPVQQITGVLGEVAGTCINAENEDLVKQIAKRLLGIELQPNPVAVKRPAKTKEKSPMADMSKWTIDCFVAWLMITAEAFSAHKRVASNSCHVVQYGFIASMEVIYNLPSTE